MAETVLNEQQHGIDSSSDAHQQKQNFKRILGVILTFVMIALSVYVYQLFEHNTQTLTQSTTLALDANVTQASNYRSYVKQYKDTKAQLEETTRKLEEVNRQLDEVNAQLTTTKGVLSETQIMLAQAQTENQLLKDEIQGLGNVGSISELEARIAALKGKNDQVTEQLNALRRQMSAYEGEFANVTEGKSLLTLFQNKIKLIKSRMKYLNQEAYFTKIAAQKEHDRVAALNGNNGYIVKDGRLHKADQGFSVDVKLMP